jgi:hypothetical protein
LSILKIDGSFDEISDERNQMLKIVKQMRLLTMNSFCQLMARLARKKLLLIWLKDVNQRIILMAMPQMHGKDSTTPSMVWTTFFLLIHLLPIMREMERLKLRKRNFFQTNHL